MAKTLAVASNWLTIIANESGLGNDGIIEYHLRNGLRFRAWGGRLSYHVIDVIFEVLCQDAYGVRALAGSARAVVDVGAHIGTFSVEAAKRNPRAVIVAFEPVPYNFELCQANLVANNIVNVTVHNEGLWSHKGRRPFYLNKDDPGGHSTLSGDGDYTVCPVRTLAEVLDSIGVPEVDLVKLDCEGAEYEILMSLDEDHLNRVKRISLEAHSIEGKEPADLIDFLSEHGFKVERTGNPQSRTRKIRARRL